MTQLNFPPRPDRLADSPTTAPYWAAARELRIVLCECGECHRLRMPPTAYCPNCQSQRVEWREVPGTGFIYTYTVVHRAVSAGSAQCIPYAPAVIELDEAPGIRLVSAIVESDSQALQIGARVRPVWSELRDGHVVAYFSII